MQLPILLDFGLSIFIKDVYKCKDTNDLRKYFYVYAPSYYIWCPEIHLLCYLINIEFNPGDNELMTMSEDITVNLFKVLRILSPSFMKQYQKTCFEKLKWYNSRPNKVQELINSWKTWDNFSLSVLYIRFLHYINMDGFIKNNFWIFFSKILIENINPDPLKRNSIKKTMIKFKEMKFENMYKYDDFVNLGQISSLRGYEEELKKDLREERALVKKTHSKKNAKGISQYSVKLPLNFNTIGVI